MSHIMRGTIHRFESVTELVDSCRTRYPGADVKTVNEDGNFVLRIRGRLSFDSLIAHFEGSRCYMVMLA